MPPAQARLPNSQATAARLAVERFIIGPPWDSSSVTSPVSDHSTSACRSVPGRPLWGRDLAHRGLPATAWDLLPCLFGPGGPQISADGRDGIHRHNPLWNPVL